MRLYYQKDVLTFMCFFNEMFYSGLYLLNFTTGPTRKFNVHPTLQINRLKPIFFSAFTVLGISLFKVLTIIAFPVAVAKSFISLLHAYVAANNLAIIDVTEREEARQRDSAKKPE